MSQNSHIEWTNCTWNPILGCRKTSPGCANCYALKDVWRMGHNKNPRIFAANQGLVRKLTNQKLDWTGSCRVLPDRMDEPLRWRKPVRVFANSLSDLFYEDLSLETIQEIFSVMWEAHWHEYQILTKRAERMLELSPQIVWPANVFMGTSVENADYVGRIDCLRRCGAKNKFISMEPLLGPMPDLDLSGIDWLILGGESGAGARPIDLAWVRDIRDQCAEAGVPFFLKQLGTCWAKQNGSKSRKGDDMTEWPEDLRIRQD